MQIIRDWVLVRLEYDACAVLRRLITVVFVFRRGVRGVVVVVVEACNLAKAWRFSDYVRHFYTQHMYFEAQQIHLWQDGVQLGGEKGHLL